MIIYFIIQPNNKMKYKHIDSLLTSLNHNLTNIIFIGLSTVKENIFSML
jgi:hypothetical protein